MRRQLEWCVAVQALTIKLQNLRQKGAGRKVDRLPDELADDEESDFSDDEL